MKVRMRFSKRTKTIVLYLSLFVLLIVTLFPIYFIFITSFRTTGQIYSGYTLFPEEMFTGNYIKAFIEGPNLRYMGNSLFIASANTLLVLLIALPAAYVFSRYKIYGAKHLFFWIITNRMAPPVVFIIPFFIMAVAVGLVDTYLALIIAYFVFNLPFAIWLLKGMLDGIPKELDDAALIDGCSVWGVLRHIITPLARPGIAVTGLLVWLFAWNEFIFALILTATKARTIAIGLYAFATVIGIDHGGMAAVAIVSMIPAFLLLFFIQKHIVQGLTFGAVGG